ncbi:MAG: alpha-amylase family glycosyl hydrolase, partial [Candidatus Nanopelagicales bacterium]
MNEILVHPSPSDDLDWFRRGACYQIFPDRFARVDDGGDWELDDWDAVPTRTNYCGGNLAGVTSKLGYLESLGVASLYTTPIFEAPANHRYDTADYLAIAPMLGTEDDFRTLVTAGRQHGIAIILDGVFNHCGETFPPFVRALAGERASRDMFYFHPETDDYQTVGGAKFMPKLNHENPATLDYVLEILRKWDTFGIAGWRLDVPWKVSSEFWHKVRGKTTDLNASQLWIAEAWAQWAFAQESFESVMNYHSRNRLLDLVHLHHADAEDFFGDYAQWTSTRSDPSLILNVVGSHDTARIRTMCDGSARDSLMILALNTLLPGVPMLYYGDEIGLEGDNDPGCRGTYPRELNQAQTLFLETLKPLLNARAHHKALSHGDMQIEALRNRGFVVSRTYEDCTVRIAGNTSDSVEPFAVPRSGVWQTILGTAPRMV